MSSYLYPSLKSFLFPYFLSSLFFSLSFSFSFLSPLDILGRIGGANTDLLDNENYDHVKILFLVVILPQLSRKDAVNPYPNPNISPPGPDWSLNNGGCVQGGGGNRGEQGRRLKTVNVVRGDNKETARRKKRSAAAVVFGNTDVVIIVIFVVNVLVVLAIFAMVQIGGR